MNAFLEGESELSHSLLAARNIPSWSIDPRREVNVIQSVLALLMPLVLHQASHGDRMSPITLLRTSYVTVKRGPIVVPTSRDCAGLMVVLPNTDFHSQHSHEALELTAFVNGFIVSWPPKT